MSILTEFAGGVLGGVWGQEAYSGETMDLNHWGDDIWQDGSWQPEAWGGAAAEAEEAVTLGFARARQVDFVISPPYYMHQIQAYQKNSLGFAAKQHGDDEQWELVEMLQLYRIATHALAG